MPEEVAESAARQGKRRLGRPRKREALESGPPREEILNAAATLFETNGFSGTTTRQIAAAVGLEQGSLFHYFRRKDEMLAELLDRTLDPALKYAQWLDEQPATPQEKLFLLAYRDTLNICSGPHNLAMLMLLPEATRPEFVSYWNKRERLKRTYDSYVREGFTDGTFSGVEPTVATELVFAMVESSIHWFVRGRDDPSHAATHVAAATLRLVLSDARDLPMVIERASERTVSGPDGLLIAAPRPIAVFHEVAVG